MKLGEHKTKIKTQKKLVLLKTAWQHTRAKFNYIQVNFDTMLVAKFETN